MRCQLCAVELPPLPAPAFVNASSAVTADGFSEIFQGYRWLTRIALVAKTLAMGFSDLQWTVNDQAQTSVLDFKGRRSGHAEL
jgi:hypothetical protein